MLRAFAEKHGLYLDKKGPRRGIRKGVKLQWVDSYKNTHELDYVLERGATPTKVGRPVAFIETAWRRYTKQSKNKAQEIQGAILPIADKHHFSAPFKGCLLAGVYTSGSREQLDSLGFKVLYLQYNTMIEAFKEVGIDVSWDEGTPDAEIKKKYAQWTAVPPKKRMKVWNKLVELNAKDFAEFMGHLERAVQRQIKLIRVIPLHGEAKDCGTVEDAIHFVATYDEAAAHGPLVKYEVQIRYNNGDKIDAELQDKATTLDFLNAYESGNWTPFNGGETEKNDLAD
jgi:hypothetical protein